MDLQTFVMVTFFLLTSKLTVKASQPTVSGQHNQLEGHSKTNSTQHLRNVNITTTNERFDWEGGSFPYDETETGKKDDSLFYDRAVLVAPIVGTVFIILLVIIGVYTLRQYDVPEATAIKDVENLCNNCSKLQSPRLHNKLHNYVMGLFNFSTNKQQAFFIRMDSKSRTAYSNARETLV